MSRREEEDESPAALGAMIEKCTVELYFGFKTSTIWTACASKVLSEVS